MKIKAYKTLSFPEEVNFLESFTDRNYFAFYGEKSVYVYDKEFIQVGKLDLTYKIEEPTLVHPFKPVVAVIEAGVGFNVIEADSWKTLWNKRGAYIEAAWNASGSALWAVKRIDSEHLELIVYSFEGDIIATRRSADELYRSSVFIKTIPNSDEMVLELVVGKDSSMALFAKLSGKEIIIRRLGQTSFSDLSFNQEGTKFLCLENDERTVHHFSYPALEDLGTYTHESDGLSGSLIHFGDYAVMSSWGRYHSLDLASMSVTGEFIIEGHEPRPVSEIYELYGDALISDVDYLMQRGSVIMGHVNPRVTNDVIVFTPAVFKKTI